MPVYADNHFRNLDGYPIESQDADTVIQDTFNPQGVPPSAVLPCQYKSRCSLRIENLTGGDVIVSIESGASFNGPWEKQVIDDDTGAVEVTCVAGEPVTKFQVEHYSHALRAVVRSATPGAPGTFDVYFAVY